MTDIVYNKNGIPFDIDAIATDVNGKADRDLNNTLLTSYFAELMNTVGIRTVVETYVNGTTWYRVYSDGWCEQGGIISTNTNPYTLTFSKPFKDTNYQIFKNIQLDSSQGTDVRGTMFFNLTRTSATTYTWNGKENWQACGYIR